MLPLELSANELKRLVYLLTITAPAWHRSVNRRILKA